MNTITDTKKKTVVEFDSWGEFVSYALANPDHCANAAGNEGFYGTKSIDEAGKLAVTGWEKGAKEALETRAVVERILGETNSSRAQKWGYELVGDVVDIGRYLTGEPEHWLTESTGESHTGRVVKIVANISVSCGVSKESIFRRGAALLAAIDAIEGAGKRCEVWLGYGATGSYGSGKVVNFTAPIKLADQPLDQDRIAYALCHAACSRRLCFSVQAQFGAPADETIPSELPVDENVIYLPSGLWKDGYNSDESIRELVADICKRAGISSEAVS